MKISERDKLLLMILGVVVIVALYVVLLLPQMLDKIEVLKAENVKLEQEVIEVKNLVNVKTDYKNSHAKFVPFQEKILHKLDQERIILTLDRLLIESNLRAEGISFNDENEKSEKGNPMLANLSCMETELEFKGNYDGFSKFLEKIGNNNKKIVIKEVELGVESKEETTVNNFKGRIVLQFYASNLNLANDEEPWVLPKTAGTNNPFIKTSSVSTNVSTGNQTSPNNTAIEPYDLVLTAKAFSADYPTVMMGTNNDLLGESFIFADNEGVEDVELRLYKQNDEYKCEYKTKANSYSGTIPFVSGDNQVVLKINSSPRTDAKDKSGVKITLINETDKQLVVKTINEDESKPRVDVVKQEGNILLQ